MSRAHDWIAELQVLTVRFAGWGFSNDMATLTPAELWGLLRFLRRLDDGTGNG